MINKIFNSVANYLNYFNDYYHNVGGELEEAYEIFKRISDGVLFQTSKAFFKSDHFYYMQKLLEGPVKSNMEDDDEREHGHKLYIVNNINT